MKLHQSLSAGNIRLLILSLVASAVVSLLPISSHAAIDWNEGFEYDAASNLWAVWDESCQSNPTLSTARVYSGSKSLRLVYNGVAGVDPGAGGCYMDRYLPAKSDTLYTRFYMYMDNFTVNSTGTKVTWQGENAYPSFWWNMMFGQKRLSVSVQGITLDNGTRGTEEVYGGLIPQNQWVCIETRLTMSSPGVDNGIIQAWINGASTINKTTQRMRPAQTSGSPPASPTTQFQLVRLYVQHGVGTIYYDDYAVSRNARIGCSGSAPSNDTVPPAAPSGVR